jgi:predicted permease
MSGWKPSPARLEPLWQDLRHGLRQLQHNPGFTGVAVVTLALGIGVNTSIFSLLNALLLRPLPVPQADRVVALYRGDGRPCSYLDYLDLRERNRAFSGLAADLPNESALDVGDTSAVVLVEAVSYNYASVLQTMPLLGRWFSPEDESAAAGQFLAVISYQVWQTRFAGDPDVVGRHVRLESQWYTVIGVATKDFQGTLLPIKTALWVPLAMYAQHNEFAAGMTKNRLERQVSVLGRLKPDVTVSQAEAEVNVLDGQLQKEYSRPEARRTALRLETAREVSNPRDRQGVAQLMILLMAVVGLVLLIACANLANLLLARGIARRREMAIRMALGAGRARIVQQTMIESLLLALMGAAVGLMAAGWTNRLIESSMSSVPFPIAVGTSLAIDGRVLSFTLVAAVLTALLFGLLPAVHSSRPDLTPVLKGGGGSRRVEHRRFSLRNLYVVAQVSFSLMLLVVGGLFVQALRNAHHIDPGFDARRLLSVRLYLAKPEFTDVTGKELYHRVEEHARSLPGVRDVTLSYASPLLSQFECVAPDGPAADPSATRAGSNIIGASYFATMGIPLLNGREFTSADNSQAPPVVIVNDVLARRYWPGRNPIGSHLRIGRGCAKGLGTSAEIVGVAKDARYAALDKVAMPFVFVPFDQRFAGYVALIIRTEGNPIGLAASIRTELRGLDSRLRIYEVEAVSSQMETALWQVRWEAWMLGAFAALALLIAAVGLYGVIAFSVQQRTQEIGIRMALGAQRRDVLRLVLGNGLALTLVGVALGLAASLALTRLLRGFLYGLDPSDGTTYVAAALLWMAVALFGSYVPAYRATRVDPLVALRDE